MLHADFKCEQCGMIHESQNALKKHLQLYCVGSNYADESQLEDQFKKLSINRDIGLYGRKSLVREKELPGKEQDAEYRHLLRQIQQAKSMKHQLGYQKKKAFEQLEQLEQQQTGLLVDKKRNQLQQVYNMKQKLKQEQDQLQQQLKMFQQKKKKYDKQRQVQSYDHLHYQQGKQAGNLQKQRGMFEDQLHDIQLKIRQQKLRKEKVQKQLQGYGNKSTISYKPQPPFDPMKSKLTVPPAQYNTKLSRAGTEAFQKTEFKSYRGQSKTPTQSAPGLPANSFDQFKFLSADLNTKGKSQQDALIQMLITHDYDALRILSKIPKNSQLYELKLQQFKQMSQMRNQIKQKAHKKRVQKVKRQFQFEQQLEDNQRRNALWVDQNRKAMMQRQAALINNYEMKQKMQPSQLYDNKNQFSKQSLPRRPEEQHQIPSYGPLISQKNQTYQTNRNIMDNPYLQQKPLSNLHQKQHSQFLSHKQMTQKLLADKNQNLKPIIHHHDPNSGTNIPSLQNLWGFKVSILRLKNYTRSKPIKFKVIVSQQGTKRGLFKQQFSTSYHDNRAKPGNEDPFNPNTSNKIDQQGYISYHQSFYIETNLQELHNKTQRQIYLLLILAQKDVNRQTAQPEPYAWYCFKLTHFGKIRQGRFTFNLYGDELAFPSDMNKMKKKYQQQVQIQLDQILCSDIPRRQNINQQLGKQQDKVKFIKGDKNKTQLNSNKVPPSRQKTPSIPPKSRSSKAPSVKEPKDNHITMKSPISYKKDKNDRVKNQQVPGFFEKDQAYEFQNTQYKKPKNFDFIIKQARTLPSWIGPIKLQITFIDQNNSTILPKEEVLCELGNDMYNPYIQYVRQIRNEKSIPPSTVAFIRIFAISTLDYRMYMLGFSIFYMFYNSIGQPLKSNKNQQYLQSVGCYQIPIFWGSTQPKFFVMDQISLQFPIIPCASLLVGVLHNNSQEAKSLPEYSQNVYNTSLFPINELEQRLFQAQYKRQKLDTNKHVKGFLQYKGIKKDYSGQEAAKFIFKSLTPQPRQKLEPFNVNIMSEYTSKFGFFFIIDSLQILEGFGQYFYYVTVCLCPPAKYYHRKTLDLNFCFKIDQNRSTNKQLFYLQNQFFYDAPYKKNTSVIVEVNRVKIVCDQNDQDIGIQGIGYMVFSIFDTTIEINSVDCRQDRVHLIDGDIDLNEINLIQNDPQGYINQRKKQSMDNLILNYRVVNGFFPDQYRADRPDKIGKSTTSQLGRNVKPFSKMLPKNKNLKKITQELVNIINDNYNLALTA